MNHFTHQKLGQSDLLYGYTLGDLNYLEESDYLNGILPVKIGSQD